jgi:hypothetical protein
MDFVTLLGPFSDGKQAAGSVRRDPGLSSTPFRGTLPMRPIASLALALILSGCGYQTWWNPPFTTGFNPNRPNAGSENMARAEGHEPAVAPLTTEPGKIWPGPLPPPTTLKDLEMSGLTSQPEAPVPGSPLQRNGGGAPTPSPNPATGSGMPPPSAMPELANPQSATGTPSYAMPAAPPPGRNPAGQVIHTQEGPAVTTGGGPGYKTTVSPGGGQSIVVPNGNGTSTVIHPDGRIETIPTPK